MGPTGLLATASWDATVQVYDLSKDDNDAFIVALGAEDGADQPDSYQMGGLYGVAFSNTDARVIGCVSADKCAYLWNHQTGGCISKLEGHEDEVNGISFHTTQQVMCTTSDDCTAIIWDFQEGMKLRTLDCHEKAVYGSTFLGQDQEYNVATCCFDQKLRIFDLRDKRVVFELQGHLDDVIGIDYTEKSRLLATGSDDGCICVWDTRNWSDPVYKINTREIPGIPNNEVKRVRFSHDGRKVAAGCSSQQALIFDVGGNMPSLVAALPGHQDCVFDVAWGIDATGVEYLVDASHDHTSFVWRPM
jgi:WD40 repeat protein